MKSFLRDYWFSLLLILVVCTRVPFLFTGYGADPDAWRVAFTASTLWNNGIYLASRFPGYPLHEFISAPFVAFGGSVLSNTATLAATLVLLTLWKQLAETHGRNPKLLAIGLAFAPQFWENSAITMDYNWSLLFLVACYAASLQGKPAVAGICLGLAVGLRPTNIVAIVPMAVLFLAQPKPLRNIATCLLASGATALASFIPVFATYGFQYWFDVTVAQSREFQYGLWERVQLFLYRSVYSIGPLATALAVILVLKHRNTLATMVHGQDRIFVSSLAGLVAFLLLFLWYPIEREYLLPGFIFLFLVVDRLASAKEFQVFIACVISFSMINPDINTHQGITRGTFGFNVRGESVIDEWMRRDEAGQRRATLAAFRPEGKGVIMTGGGQIMWFENENMAADPVTFLISTTDPTAHFVHNPEFHVVDAMKREEVELAHRLGLAVYCFAPSQEYLEIILGYNMGDAGVRVVP